MDTSILLARLIGPLLVVVGVGVLLNPRHYAAMIESFLKDTQLYYFSGALAFVGGVAMILFHNLWVADWRVIITIIGWLSLLKGSARILIPAAGSKIAKPFASGDWVLHAGAALLLIVGAVLSYQGFFAT